MYYLNQKWNSIPMPAAGGIAKNVGEQLVQYGRCFFAMLFLICVLVHPASGQSNGVLREVWSGFSGSSLNSFTNYANLNAPNAGATHILTNLFEGPPDYADGYGDKFRALLIPAVTGVYVFWVQGDDAAALFLSPDESPVNKVQIAYNTNTAITRAWYTFPSQQSSNIFLEAGKRYYIEAIHSAGTGDDAFAVGWKLPNGTYQQPMPVSRLWTYGLPGTTKPVITSNPVDLTVIEKSMATFRVSVSNFDAVRYQWQRNGANVLGSTGASLTLPASSTNDHGASFRCVITNSFGAVTSVAAVLTVTTDTIAPVLENAATLGSNLVQVLFSEPVDLATALSVPNYSINNGAFIAAAKFGSSTRAVILTIAGLQRGMNYTITANNVADRSAAKNTIAPNSQQNFTTILNGVYREIFTQIPGSLVPDLTGHPSFPNSPTTVELLTDSLETASYPSNNFGQRLRALIIPPTTGEYRFWVSAHDTAVLYLGTDASPASAQVIASVTQAGGVATRQYEVQAGQQSAPVMLNAGQQYYLEVRMKGGISFDSPPDHL
ncbi:MAG TPA: immunoglobulin domain-containing protein, partial [Candidatus Limnocylindria bacterium]|nr:immunoglobulin domain-containing protein [Candidatus Limnocylindria bacterium]